MKERLIIIFVAIVSGLIITGAGFFIYQSTKKVNDRPIDKTTNATITPKVEEGKMFVKVAEPSDESITTKRTLSIKGSTNPDNIIVVSTNLEDVQGKPSQDGNFSITVDIDAGANKVITRAISPSGDSVEDVKTITYSTEDF